MSTKTTTRRPAAKTMRKMTGIAADATPAEVVAAWVAIGSPRTMADVPAPAAKPAKQAKPAKEQPAKAKAAPANCGCGCGQPTITAKATFLAGHDARHAGVLGRGLAIDPEDAPFLAAYALLTPALQAKVDAIRLTATKKAASKTAREVAKVAAKRAYDEAMAAI